MKKITLLLFLFAMVFQLKPAISQSGNKAKPIRFSICIDFIIASKKQNCEGGIGICKYGPYVEVGRIAQGCVSPITDTELEISFLKTDMSDEIRAELEQASRFPIDQMTYLPEEASAKLGYSRPPLIVPSEYPIRKTDDAYTITVRIE